MSKPDLTVSQCEKERIPPAPQPPIAANAALAFATCANAACATAESSPIRSSRALARSWFSGLVDAYSTHQIVPNICSVSISFTWSFNRQPPQFIGSGGWDPGTGSRRPFAAGNARGCAVAEALVVIPALHRRVQ